MQAELATALDEQRALLEQRFPQFLVTLGSGARVAVRECGTRDAAITLVLLHGISSGAASWLQVATLLNPSVIPAQAGIQGALGPRLRGDDGVRVIAWDAPGYGHSTPLEQASPTPDDYAQRLQETLHALEVRRCVLAGHSLGALVACAYAARGNGDVDRVVLISPARGYGQDAAEAARVRKQRLDALETQGVAGIAARIAQRLVSAQASEAAREWVRWNAARLDPRGYRQAVELLCNGQLARVPAGLLVEVHCGEADVVTTPQACALAAQALGASYHPIANAGHASPVEQPAAVAALLARALEQK